MKKRNEQEILKEMLAKAVETGLVTSLPASIDEIASGIRPYQNQYILDLSIHAHILAEYESRLEDMTRDMNVTTAAGEALDSLGGLVGIPRMEATTAVIQCAVTVQDTVKPEENIVIHADTEITLDPVLADTSILSYHTTEETTIPAGTSTATLTAESNIAGSQARVPSGAATSIAGFEDTLTIKSEASVGGRDIEEDDSYRERIPKWYLANQRGTRECLENYLDAHPYVDDYRLEPQWNGVGTLRVVLDCPEELRGEVREGIQENCMLYTDDPVMTAPAQHESIPVLNLKCMLTGNQTMLEEELRRLVTGQVRVYLEGGVSRSGRVCHGQHIGEPVKLSRLIQYLHEEISEITNIRFTGEHEDMTVIYPENSDGLLVVEEIMVEFEWNKNTRNYSPLT